MAIWHQGRAGGRHTEKLRASAPPFPYSYSPFPEGYMRNQCRARPSLQALGWTPSLLGGGTGMGGGVEATPSSRRIGMKQRQHNDGGGEGQEGRLSRRGALWAGSSLQVVKCWGALSPIPVQRQRLEVVKSGSLVCRSSCPPTTQAGPRHPSASVSAP